VAHAAPLAVETTELGTGDVKQLQHLFRVLIADENRHDLKAVQTLLVDLTQPLFISKTRPLSKGDWALIGGTAQVMAHFTDLYKGVFRIGPVYSKQKMVGLTPDMAELYIPIVITTDYSFGAAPDGSADCSRID
jgi:hypothetical protein